MQSALPTCFARKSTQGDDKEFFYITLVTPPPPKKNNKKLKSSIRIPRIIGLTCICISNSVQSKLYQRNNFAVNLLVMTTSEVTGMDMGNGNVYKKSNILVCSRSELLRQLRTIPTRCATCHSTLAGLVNSRQSHTKFSV